MAERDDLAPFERHGSRKWTRVSDYLPADASLIVLEPNLSTPQEPTEQRPGRRWLWLPIYLLGLAAAALWMSGALDRPSASVAAPPQAAAAAAAAAAPGASGTTRAEGILFGLCDEGGGTNCVVDGDTFFIGGKSVRVAGIEVPRPHAPRCGDEAVLGHAATLKLHALLNSGPVTMTGVGEERDRNGRLLRQVRAGDKDVAGTMMADGLARRQGDSAGWC